MSITPTFARVATNEHHHDGKKGRKKKKNHHHHHHRRPPTRSERLRAWVDENRGLVAVCVFVTIAAVAGLVVGVVVGLRSSSLSASPASSGPAGGNVTREYFPSVTILNQPHTRNDVYGNIIDVHDGNIVWIPPIAQYALIGMAYGPCIEPQAQGGGNLIGGDGGINEEVFAGCAVGTTPPACGSNLNHNVSLWLSKDLSSWAPVFGPGPEGAIIFNIAQSWPQQAVVYCAKGLWNSENNELVVYLFINAVENGYAGSYGVIKAPLPTGPWTIQTTSVDTLGCSEFTDDMGFAQDDVAPFFTYFIYTCYANQPDLQHNHQVFIEQMTPDYYGTLGTAAWSGPTPLNSFTEATALGLTSDGRWLYLHGVCSCYGSAHGNKPESRFCASM